MIRPKINLYMLIILAILTGMLLDTTRAANDLIINPDTSLSIKGNSLSVDRDLTVTISDTANDGLIMTNALDMVTVNGTVTFTHVNNNSSATSEGNLAAGEFHVKGDFSQTNGGGAATGKMFASTGTKVVFDGAGTQTVNFANPGTLTSHFYDVDVNMGSGTVNIISDLSVNHNLTLISATTFAITGSKTATIVNQLISPSTATPAITSPAPGIDRFNFIVNGGVNVDGLNFSSAANNGLQLTNGTFTAFKNVKFTNAISGGRHLSINHTLLSANLENISLDDSFGVSTGKNVYVNDTNAGSDVVVNIINPTGNGAGSSFESENGGAIINWVFPQPLSGGGSNDDPMPTPTPTPIPPVTDFAAIPTIGIAPLNVQFTDSSTGNISLRSWEFGNGQSAQTGNTNISHRYQKIGTFTVSLEITRSGVKNKIIKPDLISVLNVLATPIPIGAVTPTLSPTPTVEVMPTTPTSTLSPTPAPTLTQSPTSTPTPPMINGIVTDSATTPVADIFVNALDAVTGAIINFDVTEADGSYSIPVPKGRYSVVVDIIGTNFKPVSQEVTVRDSDVVVDIALSQRNVIRGRVTDSANNPIEAIIVNAFDFETGFSIDFGVTNKNGDYSIPVTPGLYKVGVDTFGIGFASLFFDDSDWDNAIAVPVIEGEDTLNVDFIMLQASIISGRVTDGTNPISGIVVDVFNFDTGTWINFGQTGTGGTYTVAVRSGSYKVAAFAIEQGFEDEFFDSRDEDTADRVVVPDGENVEDIDFALSRGGSISGKVIANGEFLDGIEVNAFEFESDLWISGTRTFVGDHGTGDGNYRIEGLPTGRYRVWVFDSDEKFPSRFFNNTTIWSGAEAVRTANGADTPNIDFDLSEGGIVSGKVTDNTTGNGISAITVEAYEADTGLWISSVDTDASGTETAGNYSLRLSEGEYRLRAFDTGDIFNSQYFDNVSVWNEAGRVNVSSGAETTDISFALSQGGFISGEVRDDRNKLLKGINIEVFDFNTDSLINSAVTDVNGKFSISLPPGRYRVASAAKDPDFTGVFFNSLLGNVPGWDDATPVPVTGLNNVPNINFRLLRKNGIITGKVLDEANNPLSKIVVKAFDFDTDEWVNEKITDGTGGFSITVPAGRYRVWSLPLDTKGNRSSEFYDDIMAWDLATVVEVEADKTTRLNDIKLATGHTISGKVVAQLSMNNGQSGVVVDVYDFDTGFWINSGVTNSEGKYSISGIPAGNYRVKTSPPKDSGMANRFFDDAWNWDNANRVSVSSEDFNDINFTLSKGGVITGKIIDEGTDRPISGIEVDAYDFDTGVFVNHDITDGLGNYSIQVTPGIFLVCATNDGTDFINEFFDNVTNIDQAKAVSVTADIDANVGFKLKKGGRIIGKVIDVNSKGIAGAKVNVFDLTANFWVNKDISDSNGGFFINVQNGSYRIFVNAPIGSDFVDKSLKSEIAVHAFLPVETDAGEIILSKGRGSIAGLVKDSNNTPLDGIKINVFDFDSTDQAGSDFTDVEGKYNISVSSGRYRIGTFRSGFTPQAGMPVVLFIDEYFDDIVNWGSATAVNIGSGKTETVDFTLNTAGGCIRGRVVNSSDQTPLAGVDVHVFQSDTNVWISGDRTDTNGNYAICVPNGIYRVWANPKNTEFKPKFFSNTVNFNKAKNVVISGNDKTRVDFGLTIDD